MREKLTETFPHLVPEWITEKNEREIDGITRYSNYKAWWKCKMCDHQWKAMVFNRSKGTGCPKCSGRHGILLLEKSPHLAKEWMTQKNNRQIKGITAGSGYKAWWQCKTCDHQWQAAVNSRDRGRGCRICGNASKKKQPYIIHEYEDLAKEWVAEKNGWLLEKITAGSQHKAWWKCKTCDHQWLTTVLSRTNGSGCPKCAGRHGISILEHFPNLSKEWIAEKNNRSLETVTAGSVYKAWWKCSTCDNQWRAKVEKRTKGSGCPKCKGKQRSFSF